MTKRHKMIDSMSKLNRNLLELCYNLFNSNAAAFLFTATAIGTGALFLMVFPPLAISIPQLATAMNLFFASSSAFQAGTLHGMFVAVGSVLRDVFLASVVTSASLSALLYSFKKYFISKVNTSGSVLKCIASAMDLTHDVVSYPNFEITNFANKCGHYWLSGVYNVCKRGGDYFTQYGKNVQPTMEAAQEANTGVEAAAAAPAPAPAAAAA